jgi:flagellar biosynthesis protein FliR
MTVTVHVILQILGLIVTFSTLVTSVVPTNVKPFVILAVSLAQASLAWYNHYYTPAGTKIV